MAGKADLVNSIVDSVEGIVRPAVLYDGADPSLEGSTPVPAPGGTAPLDPFGSVIQ